MWCCIVGLVCYKLSYDVLCIVMHRLVCCFSLLSYLFIRWHKYFILSLFFPAINIIIAVEVNYCDYHSIKFLFRA